MSKALIAILILLAIIIVSIPGELKRRKRLNVYWQRLSVANARKWKKMFPDASTKEIRDFFDEFSDGFAFTRRYSLKFSPNDQVMKIYRTMYPPEELFSVDALELETFAANLEQKYDIKFIEIWNEDLTLGKLFTTINKKDRNLSVAKSGA